MKKKWILYQGVKVNVTDEAGIWTRLVDFPFRTDNSYATRTSFQDIFLNFWDVISFKKNDSVRWLTLVSRCFSPSKFLFCLQQQLINVSVASIIAVITITIVWPRDMRHHRRAWTNYPGASNNILSGSFDNCRHRHRRYYNGERSVTIAVNGLSFSFDNCHHHKRKYNRERSSTIVQEQELTSPMSQQDNALSIH